MDVPSGFAKNGDAIDYLAVSVAERSAPVSVQPVVWGVSLRDTRPPQDIIRQYLESPPQVPVVSSQVNQAASAPASMPDESHNNESATGGE